jgi:hypothetical protein
MRAPASIAHPGLWVIICAECGEKSYLAPYTTDSSDPVFPCCRQGRPRRLVRLRDLAASNPGSYFMDGRRVKAWAEACGVDTSLWA